MKRHLNEETGNTVKPKVETKMETKVETKVAVEDEEYSCSTITAKTSSTTTTERLGACEVCAATAARYSCPKCEVKTCSVRCVQIHKKELACDGIRDRTKFIPLRKMTKMDFMSDYYFLEECTRFAEDRKNDRLKSFTRYNKVLPTHLFRLRNAAAERKTTLRFLLQNFSRHKENTTYYDWKQRRLYWRVEWIFVNAGAVKYVDARCSEDEPLHRLLTKYVCVSDEEGKATEAVPQKKALEYYQSVGVFGLKILLKAEGIKRSRSRFYALDATKTLKQNLAGKTLVEFPCIYVSYETNSDGFDIIDSDEDVEKEAKSYETALEEERKRQRDAKYKAEKAARVNDNAEIDADGNDAASQQKKSEIRKRKREEYEKAPSNFLFADEQLLDMFSSSENEAGNATEEES